MALTLSAKVVLSSDATDPCMYPAPRRLFGTPKYDFVFLQHGVLVSDISSWLRGKKISMCVATTADEYNALVWKESSYDFVDAQVALTGLPRHDALLKKDRERPKGDRQAPRRILVMPTWRLGLSAELNAATTDAERRRVFGESDFRKSWWGLLAHPAVRQATLDGDLIVDFMLHPNISAELVDGLKIDGISFHDAGSTSFQEMIVACDVLVTDYSSLAVDAALIDKPVAYFQFDTSTVGSGLHSWVPGYFDFDTMGFGPVFRTVEEVTNWIVQKSSTGFELDPEYELRRKSTFLFCDGKNSERLVYAVERLLEGELRSVRAGLPDGALPPMIGNANAELD